MFRRYVVGVGLVMGLLSGCSEAPYPLPDRAASAVAAEESRLAALLPDHLLWGPGTCQVRLLGTEGAASFAWATCHQAPTADTPSSGVSVPVRVDGDRVSQPDDGAGYAESVRRLFPPSLADAVLQAPERLHP